MARQWEEPSLESDVLRGHSSSGAHLAHLGDRMVGWLPDPTSLRWPGGEDEVALGVF
jgi:hypothetical protein